MKNKSAFSTIIFRLSHRLNSLCEIVASLFLLLMLVLVIIQVVARYIFDAPPQWTEEAARYCMIWMGLLGATVSFYKRSDPVLFQPDEAILQKWGFHIRLVEFIAVMTFVSPLIYYGLPFIMRHLNRPSETIEIDMAFVVMIVPIYACIVAIHALARLWSTKK